MEPNFRSGSGWARYRPAPHCGTLNGNNLDRLFDIGISRDDDRRMPSQFHGDAFHVQARQRGQLLADLRGPRERHFPDDRMRDEVGGNFSRIAIDEVDRAIRQPGLGECPDQFRRGGGRISRPPSKGWNNPQPKRPKFYGQPD